MRKHALGILFFYLAGLTATSAHADFASGTVSQLPVVCPAGQVASTTLTNAQVQKQDYCQAAQGATAGNTADSSLWKVWSAVAGVCVASCASVYGQGTPACPVAMTGGSGVDAVTTKNYASALQSTGSTVLSQTNATTDKAKRNSACMAAAQAAVTAITRNKSANNEASVASSNLSSAASLAANDGAVKAGSTAGASAATAGGLVNTQAGNGVASGASGTASAALAGENASCTAARATGSGTATLQCAIAQDSSLQPMATSAYQNAFQQATGQSLNDFLEKSGGSGGGGDSAASAIAGLAASTLKGEGDTSMKAADVLRQMQAELMGDMPSTEFASAPAAKKPSGTDDPDFNAVLSNVMSAFGQPGAKTADGQNPPAKSLDFGQTQYSRNPASVATAEDRTISLFQRVTSRYTAFGRKLLTEGTFAE